MSARPITDLTIATLLVFMLATGLPKHWPGVRAVRSAVGPVAEATGLSQRNWTLFAPNVDKVNAWVEATITWNDGSTSLVGTPDWRERSALEAIAGGRAPKYVSYLPEDNWSALWAPFARWAVRHAEGPGLLRSVDHVVLTRHSWRVPHPDRLERARARFGTTLPPPRADYPKHHVFATWRPSRGVVPGLDADGDGVADDAAEGAE